MAALLTGTWADHGYGKVGPNIPGNPKETENARKIAEAFRVRTSFDVQDDSTGVWIRDPARVQGSNLQPAAQVVEIISQGNFGTATSFSSVARVAASAYGRFGAATASPRSDCNIDAFKSDHKSAKGIYDLTYAVSSCQAQQLQDLLREDIAPEFFRLFPSGKIVVISTNYEFEKRYGGIRLGYTLSQYDASTLPSTPDLKALQAWQMLTPMHQLRTVLDLGMLALYPVLAYFQAARPGMNIIFIPGELVEIQQPDFPASWLDIYRSRWDFARGPSGSSFTKVHSLKQPFIAQRRYLQTNGFDSNQVVQWLEWLVNKYNDLAVRMTDPTIHESGAMIDFVDSFEHALSVDRLLRKAMSCQVSSEIAVRKYALFEVADILDELYGHWATAPFQKTERFKLLFNPSAGRAMVLSCLSSVPAPIRSILSNGANAVYDDLRDTIYKSVFVPSKLTSNGGVMVRDRHLGPEVEEDKDTFVANIIRALRNTHHGYMTAGDKQNRPSRYLALVSGETPDTMTHIGVLLGLAVLGDPTSMLGVPIYPKHAFV
ncbi:hypothetical protein [Methylobacterium sp. 22177]|uniref:hypothetical protein n=1 Tax=Methylobacterium sp. 22177 TaxID=3453885 RepID=UPI003F84E4E1